MFILIHTSRIESSTILSISKSLFFYGLRVASKIVVYFFPKTPSLLQENFALNTPYLYKHCDRRPRILCQKISSKLRATILLLIFQEVLINVTIRHLFVCFLHPRNKLKKGTLFSAFCSEAMSSKKLPFSLLFNSL